MRISGIGIAAREVINVIMKSHTNTGCTMSCMQHAPRSKLIMHIKTANIGTFKSCKYALWLLSTEQQIDSSHI